MSTSSINDSSATPSNKKNKRKSSLNQAFGTGNTNSAVDAIMRRSGSIRGNQSFARRASNRRNSIALNTLMGGGGVSGLSGK